MKKHEFYKKYANLHLGNRHIVARGTLANGLRDAKSPYELYLEMSKLDTVIAEAVARQEELLKIAPRVFNYFK